jgi:hypothetical protein
MISLRCFYMALSAFTPHLNHPSNLLFPFFLSTHPLFGAYGEVFLDSPSKLHRICLRDMTFVGQTSTSGR